MFSKETIGGILLFVLVGLIVVSGIVLVNKASNSQASKIKKSVTLSMELAYVCAEIDMYNDKPAIVKTDAGWEWSRSPWDEGTPQLMENLNVFIENDTINQDGAVEYFEIILKSKD